MRRDLIHSVNALAVILFIALLCSCEKNKNADFHDVTDICFNSVLTDAQTRSETRHQLSDYVTSFRVYGINGTEENGTFVKKNVVFPNYSVEWTLGSGNSTQTNTSGWEYVSNNQTIKYWDENMSYHYFWAIADDNKGEFSDISSATDGRVNSFSVDVKKDDLSDAAKVLYYSDITKVASSEYGNPVVLQFHPYVSKVRIGFYETIHNSSVKDFEVSSISSIVDEGSATLTYDYQTNQVKTVLTPGDNKISDGKALFGGIDLGGQEYLAESSDAPSYLGNGFVSVLPWETRTQPLTIKCKYKQVNSSGKVTQLEDITASVAPGQCQWLPGFEYTYIFKITSSGGLVLVSAEQVAIKDWKNNEVDRPLHNW